MRSRVGHNAVLSFLGLAVPLILAAVVMPVAARHLGPARFGLLGLAWAFSEYVLLFDLGLGRALVKFVAEARHDRSHNLNAIISLGLASQFLMGFLVGFTLIVTARPIAERLFGFSGAIAGEAVGVFRVIGLSVPIVLLNSAQRAVIEGAERFDLSALLRMIGTAAALAVPAIGATLGLSLPRILAIVLAARFVICSLYLVSMRVAIPGFRWTPSTEWRVFRPVLMFGRWVLVSNALSPLLVYFDRFALAAMSGLAAVGFYVAPYEGVTRLLLIPAALFASLLPALAAMEASHRRDGFVALVSASQRLLGPLMALLIVPVAVFAPELIRLWLGGEYAARSVTAFRLLAVGVFFNALAFPLLVTLYARNRPDLPAKFHIAEMLVHIPLTVVLIRLYGISGAAAAWTFRVTLDFSLLLAATARVTERSITEATGDRTRKLVTGVLTLAVSLFASKYIAGIWIPGGAAVFVGTVGSFVIGSWRWLLSEPDRSALRRTVGSYIHSFKSPTSLPQRLTCATLFVLALTRSASAQNRGDTLSSSAPTVIQPKAAASESDRTAGYALILVTSDSVDRIRTAQLRDGVVAGSRLLLRSASTLTRPRVNGRAWVASAIAPQFLAVVNSAIPFSQNYGSMWAGKGLNTRTLFGARLESARVRVIVAPELILSANSDWVLRHDFYVPPLPAGRSPYDLPFYVGDFTIDQPMRFGSKPIKRLDPGETSLLVAFDRVQFGFSNENEWWGPGIRNALVLSNNAPGFPHLLLRTARPLDTHFGLVDARWIVGGLTESAFFDTVSTNNTRSIAAFALSLQTKWDPNLTVGLGRSAYSTATGWGRVWGRWLDIFAHTTRNNTATIRKDQFASLFARWVFPADGVEVYGEWGRLNLHPSLRDFLVSPNHTQGYTVGMQWRGTAWNAGDIRLQGEITQLEQSATFRDQPTPSWYTSTHVVQGYTNRGEVLGASIGPGAQSQFLGVDYLKHGWRVGSYAGRIRWNEDAHDNFGFPAYAAYCNQDVSMYLGFRGARRAQSGSLTADLTIQNRRNAFFQNGGGCPLDRRLDIHNATFAVSFTPGG